jgi:hypothetical protein
MQRDGGPGGAGGAGNPTGGSFTGPSLQLEYIGRDARPYGHGYAYSGVVEVEDSEKTMLEFKTGAHYLEVELQAFNPSASNDDIALKLYMNNSLVYSDVLWNIQLYNSWPKLIIPAYTEIKVTAENVGSSTGRNVDVILEGRSYRG